MSTASDPVETLPELRADGSGEPYCGDSTGTLDWTLFDPELLRHNVAVREQESDLPLHPARCGPCDDCLEFLEEHPRYARRAPGGVDHGGLPQSAPTVEQFRRHAEKFGPECVLERAAAYLTPTSSRCSRRNSRAVRAPTVSQPGRGSGERRASSANKCSRSRSAACGPPRSPPYSTSAIGVFKPFSESPGRRRRRLTDGLTMRKKLQLRG
jgi:hypothetical protein